MAAACQDLTANADPLHGAAASTSGRPDTDPLEVTMRHQPCLLAVSLSLLLAPAAARGQTQTADLNLGRVTAIDRSVTASPTVC